MHNGMYKKAASTAQRGHATLLCVVSKASERVAKQVAEWQMQTIAQATKRGQRFSSDMHSSTCMAAHAEDLVFMQ
jgi:hypothetical protein